jgi:hypothetical protein
LKFSNPLVVLARSLAVFAAGSATCTGADPPSSAPEPAEWMAHDIVVDLRDLPKAYSCDELRNKLRDVLSAIGSRPLQIAPYRCERALGAAGRSPGIHLRFDTLHKVSGVPARVTSGLRATIRLGPGEPQSLEDTDCELLRQIKGPLMTSLDARVVEFKLDCAAIQSARQHFRVSLQALAPIKADEAHASQLGAASLSSSVR